MNEGSRARKQSTGAVRSKLTNGLVYMFRFLVVQIHNVTSPIPMLQSMRVPLKSPPKTIDGVGVPLVGENAAFALHVPKFDVGIHRTAGYKFSTRVKIQTTYVRLKKDRVHIG